MHDIGLLAAAMLLVAAGSWAPATASDKGKAEQAAVTRPPRPAGTPARGAPATSAGCLGAHRVSVRGVVRGIGSSEVVMVGVSSAPPRAVLKVTVARAVGSAAGCDACADWGVCEARLRSAGVGTQVVRLKNGLMCVYTADTPGKIRALQVLLARRHEYLDALAGAGDKVHLCPYCREMRGAAASGKLVREVINIDGGCIVMTTSPDPAVVSRIQAQAGVSAPGRVKS